MSIFKTIAAIGDTLAASDTAQSDWPAALQTTFLIMAWKALDVAHEHGIAAEAREELAELLKKTESVLEAWSPDADPAIVLQARFGDRLPEA
jgi:hypothetical protein